MDSDKQDPVRRRIAQIKNQLEAMSGGEAIIGSGEGNLPPEIELQFLEQVLAFESAGQTTRLEQMRRAGFDMPDPDRLADVEVTFFLNEAVRQLADLGVFLSHTNHLSDRALYELLYRDVLRESVPDIPPDPDAACHIDLVGSGSEEDERAWLTYYADGEERAQWASEFPDAKLPPMADPPYDRDRELPQTTPVVDARVAELFEALMDADWDRSDGAVRLARDLPPEAVRDTQAVRNALVLLRLLGDSGPVKATARRGHLPRSLVEKAVPRLDMAERHRRLFQELYKALNEETVWPLHITRLMCQEGGLIRKHKGTFSLTRAGQGMIGPEPPLGDLFRRLFIARFRKLSMEYVHPGRRLPGLQETFPTVLWRLGEVAADWTPMEGLAEDILLPGVFLRVADPGDPDSVCQVAEFMVVDVLEDFGLVETRREKVRKVFDRVTEVRVSPLFWTFLTFDLGDWESGGAVT